MNLIWSLIEGFENVSIEEGRFRVDAYNMGKNYEGVFAIGDVAAMKRDNRNAYPMVAQPAIQQGIHLAKNLNLLAEGKEMIPFRYIDHGSIAIIVRNKAVCDFPWFKFKGFFAWLIWIYIHFINLIHVRNRIIVLPNWIIQYYQYNKSIRLIIQSYKRILPEKKEAQ